MATVENKNGFEVWTIMAADGMTRAAFVPGKGGVGASLVMPVGDQPRELLFQHPFFWEPNRAGIIPGGWPFLFPICGRLARGGAEGAYLYNGRRYQLPIHGFAPYLPWDVLENERADEIVLGLSDTEETRANYPFPFEIQLRYRVEPGALFGELCVLNKGARPMPYYAGFHPYFRTPPRGRGKEEVRLDYKPARRFVYNRDYTDLIGEREPPRPPVSVGDPDLNEQLTTVATDREIALRFPDGWSLHLTAEGVEDPNLFKYIQLYTMPDQAFFCVEPWMGFPNALNTVLGARVLAPGAEEHGVIRLWTRFSA